jgi:peptidoglycan hydrolase-like protein with peptidoglycan-binding domain
MKKFLLRMMAMVMVFSVLAVSIPQTQYTVHAASKSSSTLKSGNKGSKVKKLQQRLDKLGYYNGKINSKYDKATASAVKAFQKANGLKQTGQADSNTQKKLYSDSAKSLSEYNATKQLKSGNTGSQVKKVQEQLKKLGYYTSKPNSKFDGKTVSAVKAFQKANDIKENGVATTETRKLLNSGKGVSKKEYELKQSTKLLKSGSKGSEVKRVQEQLKKLGYYTSKPNSKFDSKTVSAVKAFQKGNELTVNGKADKATRELLNSGKGLSKKEAASVSTLKKGDRGEQVKKVQRQLKKLGYFDGNVAGNFQSQTQTAVKKFQKANSLTVNGKADKATRKLLNSGKGLSLEEYKKQLLTAPLEEGDKGEGVKKVQEQLKKLGYFDGSLGGNYGELTTAAVKGFQKANSLSVSGKADTETRKLLNSGKGVTKAEYDKKMATATLEKGDSGEQAKKVQTQLKKLGYFDGSLGGNFGDITVSAVKEFQKANDLTVNGKADTKTRKLLNSGKGVTKAEYDKENNKNDDKEEDEKEEGGSHSHNSSKVEKIIAAARAQLGKPYVWGATGMSSFDCSGLTSYAFRQGGISLSRTAYAQGYGKGTKLTKSQLKRGDLVFFNTISDSDRCDHVGIYLGDNQFIHASSGGKRVMISSLSGYYERNFSWGRCVL